MQHALCKNAFASFDLTMAKPTTANYNLSPRHTSIRGTQSRIPSKLQDLSIAAPLNIG